MSPGLRAQGGGGRGEAAEGQGPSALAVCRGSLPLVSALRGWTKGCPLVGAAEARALAHGVLCASVYGIVCAAGLEVGAFWGQWESAAVG